MKKIVAVFGFSIFAVVAVASENNVKKPVAPSEDLWNKSHERVLLAQNDDVIGACSQYWRAGGAFIQCNVVPKDQCHGNPFIRYVWDEAGSC